MNNVEVLRRLPSSAVMRWYPCELSMATASTQVSSTLANMLQTLQVSSPTSVAAVLAALNESNAHYYDVCSLLFELAQAMAQGGHTVVPGPVGEEVVGGEEAEEAEEAEAEEAEEAEEAQEAEEAEEAEEAAEEAESGAESWGESGGDSEGEEGEEGEGEGEEQP
jgi:hypothetical protein